MAAVFVLVFSAWSICVVLWIVQYLKRQGQLRQRLGVGGLEVHKSQALQLWRAEYETAGGPIAAEGDPVRAAGAAAGRRGLESVGPGGAALGAPGHGSGLCRRLCPGVWHLAGRGRRRRRARELLCRDEEADHRSCRPVRATVRGFPRHCRPGPAGRPSARRRLSTDRAGGRRSPGEALRRDLPGTGAGARSGRFDPPGGRYQPQRGLEALRHGGQHPVEQRRQPGGADGYPGQRDAVAHAAASPGPRSSPPRRP